MKRWLIALFAAMVLTLGLSCAAEAPEDPPVTPEDMIGVWQMEKDSSLELFVLPRSYAPEGIATTPDDFYVEAYWLEDSDWRVEYAMVINSNIESRESIFGNSLLGSALDVLTNGVNAQEFDDLSDSLFLYKNGKLGARLLLPDLEGTEDLVDSYVPYSDSISGYLWFSRDNDGTIVLFWTDDYDPHASITLQRVTTAAPEPAVIEKALFQPLLNLATDDEAAQAMCAFAMDHELYRMNSAALKQSLLETIRDLSQEDTKRILERQLRLAPVLWNAIGQPPNEASLVEQAAPPEFGPLVATLSSGLTTTLQRRSVGILCEAINAMFVSGPSQQ